MLLALGLDPTGPAHELKALWALYVGAAACYLGYGHATLGVRTALTAVFDKEFVEDFLTCTVPCLH